MHERYGLSGLACCLLLACATQESPPPRVAVLYIPAGKPETADPNEDTYVYSEEWKLVTQDLHPSKRRCAFHATVTNGPHAGTRMLLIEVMYQGATWQNPTIDCK